MQPLPVSAEDYKRVQEILTLIVLSALSGAKVGEYLDFGKVVITFENSKPVRVTLEPALKPQFIKPEPGIDQQ